jgi:hypothetical protein
MSNGRIARHDNGSRVTDDEPFAADFRHPQPIRP